MSPDRLAAFPEIPLGPEDLDRLMEACRSDDLRLAAVEFRERSHALLEAMGQRGSDLWLVLEEAVNTYHDERVTLGIRVGYLVGLAVGRGRTYVRHSDTECSDALAARVALEVLVSDLDPARARDLLLGIGIALDPSLADEHADGGAKGRADDGPEHA